MAVTKSLDNVSLKKTPGGVVLSGVVLVGVKTEKAEINTHSMRMKWQQDRIEIFALT